ncbi:MAG: hypothetical protein U1E30_03180 [Rhodoblastus sp.]
MRWRRAGQPTVLYAGSRKARAGTSGATARNAAMAPPRLVLVAAGKTRRSEIEKAALVLEDEAAVLLAHVEEVAAPRCRARSPFARAGFEDAQRFSSDWKPITPARRA